MKYLFRPNPQKFLKLLSSAYYRLMNIYKMEPAYSQYDWFERYKSKDMLFYDTGEKLADVDKNGRSLWYYKNGELALEYFNAKEKTNGQRCIVYSSSKEFECGRPKPRTVIGLFDFRGNGVLYDTNGNTRLKYNQTEGVVVDPKIGPPGRWMWHSLNEPPVLKSVFINARLSQVDLTIEELGALVKHKSNLDTFTKEDQANMSRIELRQKVKEQSRKTSRVFKPFQIKMKATKLNDYFSIKILDQTNIYLLFRDGQTRLKLNLGMLLNSRKIIDTDISDVSDVSTPYDEFHTSSESVSNIQRMMRQMKKTKQKGSKKKTDNIILAS